MSNLIFVTISYQLLLIINIRNYDNL